MLLNLARDCGFATVVAKTGAEGIALARKLHPTAISLDVFLPDMLGWTVLNQLEQDSATRHVPVQILTVEEERQYSLERGAFAFMNKPATTDELESALRRIQTFAAARPSPRCATRASTASCSTCACPTSRASSSWARSRRIRRCATRRS